MRRNQVTFDILRYYILNKSENATLQLSIFYEKVLDKKYLLKLNNVAQSDSQIIFAESLKKMTLSVSQKYGEIRPKFLITMVSHFMNSIGLKRKQQPHVILGVLSYT